MCSLDGRHVPHRHILKVKRPFVGQLLYFLFETVQASTQYSCKTASLIQYPILAADFKAKYSDVSLYRYYIFVY